MASDANVSRQVIRPAGYFALSFGSMVGSGWIILLGDWLRRAAPGGALLAMLAGGALMALVGCCYAELAARLPRAGGDFLYALEGLGRTAGFVVGSFITLFLVSLCAFEATALAWLVTELAPAAQGKALYHVLGESVTTDALVLGLIGAATVCVLNLRGVRSSVTFQRVVTFTFLAVVCVLIVCGFVFGSAKNLQPMFHPVDGHPWTSGAFWIFAQCAMLLNGFQAALYVIEERAADVSVRSATLSMVGGIVAAAVFYSAIILAAGRMMPWQQILTAHLPAVAAFNALSPSGVVGSVVLVVSIASTAKTWNALVLMASRILLAQAGAGMLPRSFNEARTAILTVTCLSIAGMLLGKGALIPIINMATICITLIVVLALVVLLRLRSRLPESPGFAVPGGLPTILVCLAGALLMAGFAFFGPLQQTPAGQVPLEWKLMAAWAALSVLGSRR
jgi:APA family basic amino acid/polyamine antiporter